MQQLLRAVTQEKTDNSGIILEDDVSNVHYVLEGLIGQWTVILGIDALYGCVWNFCKASCYLWDIVTIVLM